MKLNDKGKLVKHYILEGELKIVRSMVVIKFPIITGRLGIDPNIFENRLEELENWGRIEINQDLLISAKILGKIEQKYTPPPKKNRVCQKECISFDTVTSAYTLGNFY